MQRATIATIIAAVMLVHLAIGFNMPRVAAAPIYVEGNGTENNPYIIRTPAELDAVRQDLGAYYRLGNHIDLTAYLAVGGEGYNDNEGWEPIDGSSRFDGVFDGNGYTISGLKIDRPEQSGLGLFGRIDRNAVISNIGLIGVNIKGENTTGGLVGNSRGAIYNSYVTGTVIGSGTSVGGMVGNLSSDGTVTNSYTNTTVEGDYYTGGIVGSMSGTSSIVNSYAAGVVEPEGMVFGALVGEQMFETIIESIMTNSYYDTTINDPSVAGAGTGVTTEAMKMESTYNQWDFENVWSIDEGNDYPKLRVFEDNSPTDAPPAATPTLAGAARVGSELTATSGYADTDGDDEAGTTYAFFRYDPDGESNEQAVQPASAINTYLIGSDDAGKVIRVKVVPRNENAAGDEATSPATAVIVPALTLQGEGTPLSPYLITSAAQLDEVRFDLNAFYKLANDIDLTAYLNEGGPGYNNGEGWESIGGGQQGFGGVFDGDKHTISGLYMNRPTEWMLGLFGRILPNSIVTNVNLINVRIIGDSNVGALVGVSMEGSISASSATGSISSSGMFAGGLVGTNEGTIEISFADVDVTGEEAVGGLVGLNDGRINNSYALGKVSGNTAVGGLTGANSFRVANAFAAGLVTGETNTGGLIGSNFDTLTSGFYDAESTGQTDQGKGIGKTAEEMKAKATFTDWDFDNVWSIDEGQSYPRLLAFLDPVVPEENPIRPIVGASPPPSDEAIVLVDGKEERIGKLTTAISNGRRITTIRIDEQKLEQRLNEEGNGVTITIPVQTASDIVIGELNGSLVSIMEKKGAVIELTTDQATYRLPAHEINIDSLSRQIGAHTNLQSIRIAIEIATPTADMSGIIQQAANKRGFSVAVPPLSFNVTAYYGEQKIDISLFNAYVERSIAIPDTVDPDRLTTGVVVDPDGTVRHVPTRIVRMDGVYYGQIKSLTNSAYAVIWHPVAFADMAQHWAEAAVNDMGSRIVIEGVGNGKFDPDRNMTRAEFAAVIIRALGLPTTSYASQFADVKGDDWYSGAIATAYAYGLIAGYHDGTFRPSDSITREQVMAIIAKAMRLTGLEVVPAANAEEALLQAFTDSSNISTWARSAVAMTLQAGIVTGRGGSQLASQAHVTRAEVAVMLVRLLQKSDLI